MGVGAPVLWDMIVFEVTRSDTRAGPEVVHAACHAMARVWTRWMGDRRVDVRVDFVDVVRTRNGAERPHHGVATPGERSVTLALGRIDNSMGPHVTLEFAVIPTAAHEMMHLVQGARGDALERLVGADGLATGAYEGSAQEAEARQAGLDVLKSMLPEVVATFKRKNGEVERTPEEGSYPDPGRYRVVYTDERRVERIRRWLGLARATAGSIRPWRWHPWREPARLRRARGAGRYGTIPIKSQRTPSGLGPS